MQQHENFILWLSWPKLSQLMVLTQYLCNVEKIFKKVQCNSQEICFSACESKENAIVHKNSFASQKIMWLP